MSQGIKIMEAYEAMQRMSSGIVSQIAKAVNRSPNLVARWCLPSDDYSDSGALSDLDRLERAMSASLLAGKKNRDALAPLFYLNQRFGLRGLPPVTVEHDIESLTRQTALTMKEVSEAIAKSAEVMADGDISPNDRREALKEIYEGIESMMGLAEGFSQSK